MDVREIFRQYVAHLDESGAYGKQAALAEALGVSKTELNDLIATRRRFGPGRIETCLNRIGKTTSDIVFWHEQRSGAPAAAHPPCHDKIINAINRDLREISRLAPRMLKEAADMVRYVRARAEAGKDSSVRDSALGG